MALTIPKESYNQQALAATQQIREQVLSNAVLLKADLPTVEAVVEIGVETVSHNTTYIQRVAALRFNKNADGKVQFNVTVYKQENRPEQELLLSDVDQSNALALLPHETQLVQSEAVLAQPASLAVINSDSLATMDNMEAQERCPEARQVLSSLGGLFKNGIPLPRGESMVNYHVDVLTKDGKGFIQHLSSREGFGQNRYLSTGVMNSTNIGADKLEGKFTHLVEVAKGNALPTSMANKPGAISSATQSFAGKVPLTQGIPLTQLMGKR